MNYFTTYFTRAIFFGSILSVTFSELQANASLSEPQEIGKFGNWTAYKYVENKETVCFLTAPAAKSEGKYTKRNPVNFKVTLRSGGADAPKTQPKKTGETSFSAGYTYGPDVPVNIKIGKNDFTLFTHEDTAWAADDATDKKLIDTMLKGKEMIVLGKSLRGTETQDIFSLEGFQQGMEKLKSACEKAS